MRVKALLTGYYDNKRRKAGTEFELKEFKGFLADGSGKPTIPHVFSIEEQFSSKWMLNLDPMPIKKDVSLNDSSPELKQNLQKKVATSNKQSTVKRSAPKVNIDNDSLEEI